MIPALEGLSHSVSFDDAAQYSLGSEHSTEVAAQNVEVKETDLILWPQGDGLGNIALAAFPFSLKYYDEERELQLRWQQQPPPGKLSIALANWQTRRWDWYAPQQSFVLPLPELGQYIGTEGECLVLLAVSGQQPGRLERLSFGSIAEPQPVEIVQIAPHGGTQASTVRFSTQVKGEQPHSYHWHFGGGASPNESSEAEPSVKLAGAGSYLGLLTVTNRFSSKVISFSLDVHPPSSWVRSLGTKKNDEIRALAVGPDGSIYAGLCLEFGESCIAKLSQTGQIIWIKRLDGLGPVYVNGLGVAEDGTVLAGLSQVGFDQLDKPYVINSRVVRLSPEGAALSAYRLPAKGDISFGPGGRAAVADAENCTLYSVDSASGVGWRAPTLSDSVYQPFAGRACFAADGGIWLGCSARDSYVPLSGPCVVKLNAAGQVQWGRFAPLEGEQSVSGICAMPNGVFLVANPESAFSAAADLRSPHVTAFDNSGNQLYRSYRASSGRLNPPLLLNGQVYVGGSERRERSDGKTYYTALSAYDQLGKETGAWGMLSMPLSAGLALAAHPDGSLLIGGRSQNAYVSTYKAPDLPIKGPLLDYRTIPFTAIPAEYQAVPVSFSTSERGLTLDTGGGEKDALLLKFMPQP